VGPRADQEKIMTDELRWDFATSVEEVMTHLHAFVMARQVLYLGVSDTPAWVVVKANECKPSTCPSSSRKVASSDFAVQLPARTG
jgi:aryl-alcohol dehydrogenase-like predicted oxidoreductase